MKIRVTLKDPDTMHDAVKKAVRKQMKDDPGCASLSRDEANYLLDERVDPIEGDIVHYWMCYGEYLTVEFDTDANTATVIPNRDLK